MMYNIVKFKRQFNNVNMKLEKPPVFKWQSELLPRIWQGDFEEFLSKSDEKYFYFEDIKYRKDAPFENPEENWNLIKTYRAAKYEYISFGSHKFKYYVSPFVSKYLHDFDQSLMGGLQQNPILPSDRLEFFQNSLFEDAKARESPYRSGHEIRLLSNHSQTNRP